MAVGLRLLVASDVYGLLERDLQHIVALGGDNVLFAIMVDICRRAIRPDEFILLRLLKAFTQVDVRRSLPGPSLTLWNELAQEAGNQGPDSKPVRMILREILHLYISLHQGTDATGCPACVLRFYRSIRRPTVPAIGPSSYPLCDITSNRPNSLAYVSVSQLPC